MKDCFANKGFTCNALKIKKCDNCSFYKTKEQLKVETDRSMKRILSLDKTTQNHIKETYFKNRR